MSLVLSTSKTTWTKTCNLVLQKADHNTLSALTEGLRVTTKLAVGPRRRLTSTNNPPSWPAQLPEPQCCDTIPRRYQKVTMGAVCSQRDLDSVETWELRKLIPMSRFILHGALQRLIAGVMAARCLLIRSQITMHVEGTKSQLIQVQSQSKCYHVQHGLQTEERHEKVVV